MEAGTYIRKLVHDIGEKIGGAHMLELRRTKASVFDEDTAITLYEFDKLVKENKLQTVLVPAEEAIKQVLSEAQVKETCLKQLLTGKPLHKQDISGELPKENVFAAFIEERFIGTYKKAKDGDIVAKPEFVYN